MSSSFDLSSLAELANRFREISPGEVTETLTGEFTTTREGVSGEAGGVGATFPLRTEEEVTELACVVGAYSMCCGIVGSKGKFCTQSMIDCEVQSHVGKKAEVGSGYYIRTSLGSKLAWLEPCLPLNKAPESLRDLLQSTLSHMDWIRVITALSEASESDLTDFTSAAITEEHTGKVSFAPPKTPRAKQRTQATEEEVKMEEDTPDSFLDVTLMEGVEEDDSARLKRGWKATFDKVKSLNEDVGEIFHTVKELTLRTEVLHARLQVRSNDSDQGSPAHPGSELYAVTEQTQKRQKTLIAEVDKLAQTSSGSAGRLKVIEAGGAQRDDKIKALVQQMGQTKDILFGLAATIGGKTFESPTEDQVGKGFKQEMEGKMQYLVDQIENLKHSSGSTTSPEAADLNDLKRRLTNFEKRSKAQAWEGGGQTFGHLEDVRHFVRIHMMKSPTSGLGGGEAPFNPFAPVATSKSGDSLFVGCFYDIFSAMERVKHDAGGNNQDMFKFMGDVRRAGYNTGIDDALIFQSFNVSLPGLLHKAGTDFTSRPLNLVKTKDLWENLGTGQGLVPLMGSNLETVLQGAMDSAARRYTDSPVVRELVGIMNSGIRDFWTGAKTFVTSFFQELKHGSKASDQEAWDLIRDMLSSIFKEIHEARVIARGVAAGGPPKNEEEVVRQTALVLWGSLQAARVMREVTKSEFKRHACVVPGLTLFLFNHRAPTQMVVELGKQVANLEKEKNGLKSEVHLLTARMSKNK
jgi:hypothetical protein